jgi:hypothetical protein
MLSTNLIEKLYFFNICLFYYQIHLTSHTNIENYDLRNIKYPINLIFIKFLYILPNSFDNYVKLKKNI